MSETTKQRDERRARVMYEQVVEGPWEQGEELTKSIYLENAQAVALSDKEAGLVLVPRESGTCINDDSGALLVFMAELHSHLPEEERPLSWSDFSDEQRSRVKKAYRAMLAASEAAK